MKRFLLFVFLFISVQLNAQIPSYIPKNSLVAWWPFDGDVKDYSGNNNNGKVVGTLIDSNNRNGLKNKSFHFDGNSYIEVSGLDKLSYQPITYTGWMKFNNYIPSGSGFKCRSIIGRNKGFITDCGEICLASDVPANFNNELFFWMGGNPNGGLPNSRKKLPLNEWVHFAFTLDLKGNFIWYINGVKRNSNQFANSLNYLSDFRIGSDNNNTGSSDNWIGEFDDFGLWERVLDSNEIVNIYNAKNCNFSIITEPQDKGCFSGSTNFSLVTNDTTASYQWQINQGTGWLNLSNAGQFNGVATRALSVNNVTSSNDGQLFRCIATGDCGKDTTREAKLSVWGVGVDQMSKLKYSISPNPVKDILNIDGVKLMSEYAIYSVAGKPVLSGVYKVPVDLGLLSSGVYLLSINGQIARFIKE